MCGRLQFDKGKGEAAVGYGIHFGFALLLTVCTTAQQKYSVEGRFHPPAMGTVSVSAAASPFTTSVLSDQGGRFRVRQLAAGSYTLRIFVPNRGEARRTIVLSPSTVDKKGRLRVELSMDESALDREAALNVSARQLSIKPEAQRAFADALKRLSRNEVDAAEAKLREAVQISPQFGEAWNQLGTLAYHTKRYSVAEEMFRKALETDEQLYAPLVNLGGVLINLGRNREAEQYNRHAVLRKPEDALAHAQLGMTLLYEGRFAEAETSLREAIRLDPAHFSYPQLLLAEALLRQGKPLACADALEEFLRVNPDLPAGDAIRERIRQLRTNPAAAR